MWPNYRAYDTTRERVRRLVGSLKWDPTRPIIPLPNQSKLANRYNCKREKQWTNTQMVESVKYIDTIGQMWIGLNTETYYI